MILPKIRERPGSLVFAPDGTTLVVAYSKQAIVWDLARGRERTRISGISRVAQCTAISTDGKLVASSSDERGLRIWCLDSRKQCTELKSDGRPIPDWAICFAPDGNTLATGGIGQEVYLWDVKRKKLLATLKTSDNEGVGMQAFSPDSRTLAVVDHKGAIHLWEIASQRERAILRGKKQNIAPLAFSPDGRMFAAGFCDGPRKNFYSITLWDLWSVKRKAPDAEEVVRLWDALGDDEAAVTAFRAIQTLVAFPKQSLPLLRTHMQPPVVGVEESRKLVSLIADLDNDDFATREVANKKLGDAGLHAEAALYHALGQRPS